WVARSESLAGSGDVQRLLHHDTDVMLRDKRALALSSLLHFGKRFPIHAFVNRDLLQLGAPGDQVEGPVENLGKPVAIVPQSLQPDLRALAPSPRPSFEQVEETIEQLPIRVAQQLVAHVAEFGGVAAERLGRLG